MTRRVAVAFGGVLFLALALRAWGLTHADTTDENKLVAPAVGLLKGPTETGWYPNNARYPHAAYYAYAAVFWVAERVTGSATLNFHHVGRGFQLAQAGMAIVLVFTIGRRVGGTPLGLLSALFFAVVPLHVKYSHFAHVDSPVSVVMLAALWASLRVWETGATRWYGVAGFLTGVSAATQYYGILILLAPLLAHARQAWESRRRLQTLFRPALFIGLLGVAAGAFLTSPYWFLRLSESLERYRGLSLRAAGGDLGYTSTSPLWPLLTRSPDWGVSFTVSGLVWELTVPFSLLAVGGALVAARRRDGRVVVFLGLLSLLLYAVMVWQVRMHAVKRFLFLAPLLSVLAAYGVLALARGGRWRRTAAATAVLAVLLNAGWEDGAFDGAYAGGNTHAEAVAWAKEHLPPESVVLQHGPLAFLPGEGGQHRTVNMREEYANFGRHDTRVRDHRMRSLSDWIARDGVQYVVLDSRMADRFFDPTSVHLYPDMTASWQAFLTDVRTRGTQIYEIHPRRWRKAGPRIEIYDVRSLRPAATSL